MISFFSLLSLVKTCSCYPILQQKSFSDVNSCAYTDDGGFSFLCLSAVLHFFDVEPSELLWDWTQKKNIIIIITVCVYIFSHFYLVCFCESDCWKKKIGNMKLVLARWSLEMVYPCANWHKWEKKKSFFFTCFGWHQMGFWMVL